MDELGKLRRKVENLRRYKRIVETTRNPVGLVDNDYVYQYVNRSYCNAFAIERDGIIGKAVADLFGQEMFEAVLKPQYDRCFEGQEVNYQEWFDFPGWGRRCMDVGTAAPTVRIRGVGGVGRAGREEGNPRVGPGL